MFIKALRFIALLALSMITLTAIGLGFIYLQNLFAYKTTASYQTWASMGLSDAKYRLANRYIKGSVLKKDTAKAIELLTQAGDQNHAGALIALGVLYYEGKEVPQDQKKAFNYFEKAASLNDPLGILNLGIMYQYGYGVEKNFEKALSLYEQSENMGHPVASLKIGVLYYTGNDGIADVKKAFSHFLKAAEKGNAAAQYWVGWYYEYGKGNVAKNLIKAREWYEQSAEQNFADALLNLGGMYGDGKGVQKDYLKSGEYYARAAANHDQRAIDFLNKAKKACIKKSVDKNVDYDLPWCFIAAPTQDLPSMHAVGLAYYAGKMNLQQDYETAFNWFLRCAELGYPSCQTHLAMMYDKGFGVKKNGIEAYAWFSVALKSKNLNEIQQQVSTSVSQIIYEELNENDKIKAEKKAREYAQFTQQEQ